MTESVRAMEVMGAGNGDQRRSPRRSVHAGGTLSSGSASHIAWIKDVNESGICLFTNHQPEIGESVRIELNGNRLPSYLRKVYDGKVARVRESGPGAAVVVVLLEASKIQVA